ncbi:MAG: D-alanine--D-alanine ligase [Chlamydiae bacterium]|nr:D-alanine--D-alanine ligase [Chlamydiota bacterium]
MGKIRVGIIFGGKTTEHEVSLLSAKTIYECLDKEKYEPILIGIDKSGEWHLRKTTKFLQNEDDPKKISLESSEHRVALIPQKKGNPLVGMHQESQNVQVDVIFPIVHGINGEDGTLQGVLKLAGIPFVGASVLGSAIGMDKDVMKRLLMQADIPVAQFLSFKRYQKDSISFDFVKNELGLPFFIKPANNGSSIGISKVRNETEFQKALEIAFSYDGKILIERFIKGREIECSVIGNEEVIASLPGEVIPNHDFNSWDAKYLDNECEFVIPANLTSSQVNQVQELAIKTYKVLCCEGMARVDCFLTQDGKLLVNEINTLPGFTKLSVFPRLWEASGVNYTDLIDKLIQLAIEKHHQDNKLQTSAFLEG